MRIEPCRDAHPEQGHGGGTAIRRFPAFVIAVPARNEAERIVSCLEACHASVEAAGQPGRMLLLVNNSTDATAALAAAWASERDAALDIVEVVLPPEHAHAGAARGLALDLARRTVGPGGVLMTTDADSRPERGWAAANLRETERGAALVCGLVVPDPLEHARLPAVLGEMGAVEQAYLNASLELASLLDSDPFNPWPHHGMVSGASLAIPAGIYDRIGGMPTPPCAEDRALASRVRAHDLPVVHSEAARVITSCRTEGRARGGMADTIRARIGEADYPCDERLEPADRTFLRAAMRAEARRLEASGLPLGRLLALLGLDAEERRQAEAAAPGFGAMWAFVEERSARLARRRLRHSEIAGELPHLLGLLARARQPRPAFGPAADGSRIAEGECA